ncbi:MAG TPA: AraC family transcriptional regulator [Terrimicrobiaceae bacterium]
MNNTFKVPNAFHSGLKAVGLDPAIVLRKSGLPLNLWGSGKSMVTTEQWFDLWNAVSRLSGDPMIGQKIARQTPPEHFHPARVAAQHARNFRDALYRIARYKLVCCCEQMRITEARDECRLEFDWILTQERTPLSLIDSAFVSLVEMGRLGTKSQLRPLRVELKRKPSQQKDHESYYGCRVHFNASRDLIVFRLGDLELPFVTYNAELLEMLSPGVNRELAAQEQRGSTAAGQIRWVLRRRLGGRQPEISDVARELGMSSRTLQRRIANEGTNFRQILSEERRELAKYYLPQPTLELNEVAYLLGYEDPNSFIRAFRGWEGTTPGDWRSARQRSS